MHFKIFVVKKLCIKKSVLKTRCYKALGYLELLHLVGSNLSWPDLYDFSFISEKFDDSDLIF